MTIIIPTPKRVAQPQRAENIVPAEYEDIARAMRRAWGADTASTPSWSPALPERGQATVTALLVQYAYGGILKSAIVNGIPHTWNEIEGDTVDLTRAQFLAPLTISDERTIPASDLLEHASVVKKREILLNRIEI